MGFHESRRLSQTLLWLALLFATLSTAMPLGLGDPVHSCRSHALSPARTSLPIMAARVRGLLGFGSGACVKREAGDAMQLVAIPAQPPLL